MDRTLRLMGLALVLALPASLALLLLDRWFGFGVPVPMYVGVVAATIVVAAILGLARPPRAIDVCVTLDRRLQLKDRIGTAHAIANMPRLQSMFAPLVVAEAQQVAAGLDIRRAVPVRMSNHWFAALALGLALTACALFVPARQPSPSPHEVIAAPEVIAARDAIEQTTEEILATLDAAPATADADSADAADAALTEKLAQLDDLAQQLAQEDPRVPGAAEARSEASAAMDELAEELAARGEREIEALEELARRFEGMQPPPTEAGSSPEAMSQQLREFIDAMAQGEFDQAADALDEVTSGSQSLDEQTKREAAEQLRQLSEQIERLADEKSSPPGEQEADAPAGEEPPPPVDQREQAVRDALEDLGKSEEEINEMLEPQQQQQENAADEADDTESDLRESGADEELAEKLARDIEQIRRERAAEERADEQSRDISEALRRTAEEVESAGEESAEPQDQPSGEQSDEGATDQQEQGTEQRPAAEQTPGSEPPRPQQDPSAEPQPQPGNGEQPGEESQQEQSAQPGDQQQGEPQPGSEQQPGAQPQPGQPDPDAPSMLREMQRLRDAAERNREFGEQLKERARELADTMSPEQREALERWAEAQQREGSDALPPEDPEQPGSEGEPSEASVHGERGELGNDFIQDGFEPGKTPGAKPGRDQPKTLETEATDADLARDDEPAGQKAGELPGDDELIIDPDDRTAASRQMIEARRAAERAIEQGEVPPRYHRFIQRYFRAFNPEQIRRRGAENAEAKQ